jgi:hypothetical protein
MEPQQHSQPFENQLVVASNRDTTSSSVVVCPYYAADGQKFAKPYSPWGGK